MKIPRLLYQSLENLRILTKSMDGTQCYNLCSLTLQHEYVELLTVLKPQVPINIDAGGLVDKTACFIYIVSENMVDKVSN